MPQGIVERGVGKVEIRYAIAGGDGLSLAAERFKPVWRDSLQKRAGERHRDDDRRRTPGADKVDGFL